MADIFFKIVGTQILVKEGTVTLTAFIEEILGCVLFSAALQLQRGERGPKSVPRPHSMLKKSSSFRPKMLPKDESRIEIERMIRIVGVFIFKIKFV